jgi:hypothetical protein
VLLKAIFMLYRLPECERVCSGICRFLQLPDIWKQFPDIFSRVLFLIIWEPGNDIIQPFSWIDFLCLAGGKQ